MSPPQEFRVPSLHGATSEGIFKIFGLPNDISGIRYYLITDEITTPPQNLLSGAVGV